MHVIVVLMQMMRNIRALYQGLVLHDIPLVFVNGVYFTMLVKRITDALFKGN